MADNRSRTSETTKETSQTEPAIAQRLRSRLDTDRGLPNTGPRRSAFAGLGTAVALFVLLHVAVPAEAQQPKRLTLQMALDMAESRNPDLVAARNRRAVALAEIQVARQLPNPTAIFGASRDAPHQNLLFEQPLELGSKRHYRIELARQASVLTDFEIAALSVQVRRSTREAFHRVALARAESQLSTRALQLADRLKDIAQERFEAGAVAQLEVIRAEAEASRAQVELQVAQLRENTSLSQLNALLNEPASTPWDLEGSLEDPVPEVSLPNIVQRASDSNPSIRHLLQEQKVEQSRLSLLRAERIPNLNVQFGSDFNNPPDFRVGPRGQLSLTLPIFTRNQGEIAQSLANQRLLESEISAARRSVAGKVERAYLDFNALDTQVRLYRQKLLPTARQVESLAEESYRAGKTDILFVLDAQRSLLDVERNFLQSLAALQIAYATLEEAVGGPLQ